MRDDKLRFYDEEGFTILPAPKITDDRLRELIAQLPTKALRREAGAALDRGDRDGAKTILMRNQLL